MSQIQTIPGQPDQYQTLEDCLTTVGILADYLSPALDQEMKRNLCRLSLRLATLCQQHPHCSERRATTLLWLRTKLSHALRPGGNLDPSHRLS